MTVHLLELNLSNIVHDDWPPRSTNAQHVSLIHEKKSPIYYIICIVFNFIFSNVYYYNIYFDTRYENPELDEPRVIFPRAFLLGPNVFIHNVNRIKPRKLPQHLLTSRKG